MFCLSSDKLLSTAFWIMWEKAFFVVVLVESISVQLRIQATFLLFTVGTNIIIMPLSFLYKKHLVIII